MIIDKAGIVGIKSAWYDSNRVNEHVLHGYTKVIILGRSSLFIPCF